MSNASKDYQLSYIEGVSKGGQWGDSRGSVDRGSVFCRSPINDDDCSVSFIKDTFVCLCV